MTTNTTAIGASEAEGANLAVAEWQDISTAPKDGTWFIGRRDDGMELLTQWGKTSHVPLYGWCYVLSDYGEPDYDLWHPVQWKPER